MACDSSAARKYLPERLVRLTPLSYSTLGSSAILLHLWMSLILGNV